MAEPADRHPRDDLLQHVGRHGAHHVGVDIAGRDGVDGDALAGAFLRQRLGEAVDAGFGGGVVDLAVLPGLAVDRADIDDPPEAAAAHAVDHQPAHVEARGQIGRDHLAPLLGRHAVQHVVAGDAGVVDQDLDRAESGLDLLHAGRAGREVGNVEFERGDAGLRGERLGRVVIAGVIRRHLVAGAGQRLGDGAADAARPARHDRHPCHARFSLVFIFTARRAYRSTHMAMPMPPPMHNVARPFLALRFCISYNSVTKIRVPEAPMGWPSAMAPPLTLTLSASKPSSRLTAQACAAKASLASIKSSSDAFHPARSKASLLAGIGPTPITAGSTPTDAQEAMRASGAMPRRAASAAFIKTTAAAPSLMPEALPAVTVPFLSKAGFNFASVSTVVPWRGCSSVSTTTSPLRVFTVTGTISSVKRPDFCAASARLCERAASSSCCARVICHCVATFSAVVPM